MNPRIVWPVAILLGLAILAFNFRGAVGQRADHFTASQDDPQPRPGGPFMGGGVGRFVVAYASEARVVVLDTTTGQLYQALNEDFKKISDLPKTGPMMFKDRGLRPFERDGSSVKDTKDKKVVDRDKDRFERDGSSVKDTKDKKDK